MRYDLDINKKDLIFSYQLSEKIMGKWDIYINNQKENNLIIVDYEDDRKIFKKTISEDDMKKIKEVLNKYDDFFKLKEGCFYPNILDGTTEEIYIKIDNKHNELYFGNLWAYQEEENKPIEVEICFNIFKDLNEILKEYDVEIKLDA